MSRRLHNWTRIFFIAAVALALDLISKWYAAAHFSLPFKLTSFFYLNYQQNTGIAWSIPIPHQILIPLNILLLLAIPFFAYQYIDLRYKMNQIALALIIGGAIGNVYDRIFFGYVRDFIAVGSFPVFNLADAFLCIGIFLLAAFYAIMKRN